MVTAVKKAVAGNVTTKRNRYAVRARGTRVPGGSQQRVRRLLRAS